MKIDLRYGDTIEEMFFITSGSIKLTINYDDNYLKLLKMNNQIISNGR